MRSLPFLVLVLAAATAARADVVHLTNGGTLEGVILSESTEGITVRLKYGTTRIPRAEIESIEKSGSDEPAPGPIARLADWQRCVAAIAARPWGKDLRQIPATVVDAGVLAMVPYISHAAGEREFNIYGDPDAPSCLEIGLRGSLLTNAAAKQDALDLLASLLGDAKDREVLLALDLAQDKEVREGLTFEVTPETAEDAYGGWWVSVYDEALVEKQRATELEMAEIAASREELRQMEEKRKAAARAEAEERRKSESAVTKPPESRPESYDPYAWDEGDLARARRRSKGKKYSEHVYLRGYGRGTGGYIGPSGYRGGGGVIGPGGGGRR